MVWSGQLRSLLNTEQIGLSADGPAIRPCEVGGSSTSGPGGAWSVVWLIIGYPFQRRRVGRTRRGVGVTECGCSAGLQGGTVTRGARAQALADKVLGLLIRGASLALGELR